MTMKIGEIATTGEVGKRDAMHVPVVLVTTLDKLKAGDSIQFVDSANTRVEKSDKIGRHGIVDPFIGTLKPGNRFWVFLVPEIVGNLVHHYDIMINNKVEVEEDEEDDDDDDDGCSGCYDVVEDDDDDGCGGCYN